MPFSHSCCVHSSTNIHHWGQCQFALGSNMVGWAFCLYLILLAAIFNRIIHLATVWWSSIHLRLLSDSFFLPQTGLTFGPLSSLETQQWTWLFQILVFPNGTFTVCPQQLCQVHWTNLGFCALLHSELAFCSCSSPRPLPFSKQYPFFFFTHQPLGEKTSRASIIWSALTTSAPIHLNPYPDSSCLLSPWLWFCPSPSASFSYLFLPYVWPRSPLQ